MRGSLVILQHVCLKAVH